MFLGMNNLTAILAIAWRDFIKLMRDRTRLIAGMIFPLIFIGALGASLDANWSDETGYNLLVFVFTGVLGQSLFQSAASGIISLVEDRVNDFSQEMFVSPVSRYAIIIGKILGETFVVLYQGVVIVLFGFIIGVPISLAQLAILTPALVLVCFLGGSFGLMVLANMSSERSANQIFPFLIFPQFFLAGVFSPIKELPWYLWILSRISPMTYAVDFVRGLYYAGLPEFDRIVLHPISVNLIIMAGFFLVFSITGTWLFVRNERNR